MGNVETAMIGEATVLLAEDDPDDILLTQIAFEKARLANPLQVVQMVRRRSIISKAKGSSSIALNFHSRFCSCSI